MNIKTKYTGMYTVDIFNLNVVIFLSIRKNGDFFIFRKYLF